MRIIAAEDIDDYEEEDEHIWCPFCEKAGYKVRLGGKILEANEPRPADYDSWLQCSKCYEVIPIYELPKEETIKDSVETIDNPFEQGKFILESMPKRGSLKGKKLSEKRRRNKIRSTNDKDINREIQQHGSENVHIIQDTNPQRRID